MFALQFYFYYCDVGGCGFFFAFFVNTRVYTHTEDYARKQLGDIVVTRRSSYTIV